MKRIALLLALTGCSLFTTSSPKPPPSPLACETEPFYPIQDGIGTGLTASAALGLHLASDEDKLATVAGVAAAIFAVSTIVGIKNVTACIRGHHERKGYWRDQGPAFTHAASPVAH